MNPIERVRATLAARFPATDFDLDSPRDPAGPWFLTATRQGLRPIVAEWRSRRSFGLSTPGPDDYGTGPDEVYSSWRSAAARFAALLESGGDTDPATPMDVGEIRVSRWLSQMDLAGSLGIDQGQVARMEKSRYIHVQLSTLADVIRAMGGAIEIRATFPGRPPRRLLFESRTNVVNETVEETNNRLGHTPTIEQEIEIELL